MTAAVADIERPRWWIAFVLAIAAGLVGWRAAEAVLVGKNAVAAAFVAYVALLAVSWWWTRGNVAVVVLVGYLLGPAPADNLLPQVDIFPASDFAVRPRDLLFLADVVLVGALVLARVPLPKPRLLRWWLAGLVALALYPVLVGLWFGESQSGPALLQGAVMPLRAAALIWLVAGYVSRRGWQTMLRDVARLALLSAAVLAIGILLAELLAHGRDQVSVLGYPMIVDSRPALPGWGNNILANFLCVGVAIAVCYRKAVGWRLRYVVALTALFLVGITFTEVRTAMLVALVVAEVPLVFLVIRRYWPRKGAAAALGAGAVACVLLALATVTVLPVINPRFRSLTPAAIAQHLPGEDRAAKASADGKDLGGESASTRGKLARGAGKIWARSPVFGVGWNGWGWGKSELPVMQPKPLVPLVVALDPHNGFLWLLAEAGLLGLVLLYAAPAVAAFRSPQLWWLWLPLGVATALEMVNPNLRNGHFAALVWALAALAMVQQVERGTVRQKIREFRDWLRGAPATATTAQ